MEFPGGDLLANMDLFEDVNSYKATPLVSLATPSTSTLNLAVDGYSASKMDALNQIIQPIMASAALGKISKIVDVLELGKLYTIINISPFTVSGRATEVLRMRESKSAQEYSVFSCQFLRKLYQEKGSTVVSAERLDLMRYLFVRYDGLINNTYHFKPIPAKLDGQIQGGGKIKTTTKRSTVYPSRK